MVAQIEWLTGVVRCGEKLNGKGTEYDFVATIVRDGDSCLVKAACGTFKPQYFKEIREAMLAEGITTAEYERFHQGSKRTAERH